MSHEVDQIKEFLEQSKLDKHFVIMTDRPKVKCLLTHHELPCLLERIQAYVNGRKFQRLAVKLKKEESYPRVKPAPYSKYMKFFVPSRKSSSRLFCLLTKKEVNKLPHELQKYIHGYKFQKAYFKHKESAEGSLGEMSLQEPIQVNDDEEEVDEEEEEEEEDLDEEEEEEDLDEEEESEDVDEEEAKEIQDDTLEDSTAAMWQPSNLDSSNGSVDECKDKEIGDEMTSDHDETRCRGMDAHQVDKSQMVIRTERRKRKSKASALEVTQPSRKRTRKGTRKKKVKTSALVR